MDIKIFSDLIKRKAGLTFDNGREELVEKEVSATLERKGLKSRAELFLLLSRSNGDFLDFVKNLTVNETYFFREPAYLELFSKRLINDLKSAKEFGSTIKILSAGCSTGEEPYTIIMALMERYGTGIGQLFSVIGMDIDSDALERASNGTYGKFSFRGVSDDIKDKYFDDLGRGQYRVKPFIRDMVKFVPFNFLDNSYSESIRDADAIFYRNVAIYFDHSTQKKIFADLSSLLNPGGYMILASSETLSHKDSGFMKLISMDGLFVYRKPYPNELLIPEPEVKTYRKGRFDANLKEKVVKKASTKPSPPPLLECRNDHKDSKADAGEALGEATALYRKKQYSEALEMADSILKSDSACIKAYILKGAILMNMNSPEEAKAACRKALSMDGLSRESYILLGLIAKNEGNGASAAEMFQKALYVQGDCWLSHFQLAELYVSAGKHDKAGKHYSNVLRILDQDENAIRALDILPMFIGKDNLAFLCRKRIADLQVA